MKTLAKVILLTKDAYDLIDTFIQYYGYLFDLENLVIIDNGSTDPRVLQTYNKYSKQGVTIIVDRSPFHNANVFMTKYMTALKDSCEFIIPMETDEFMYLIPRQDETNYATDRDEIHAYLNALPKETTIIRYGAFLASSVRTQDLVYKENMNLYPDPPVQMTKFWDQNWDKIIVRADAFVQVTQWLHHVEVSYGEKITSDMLGLLHFHKTGARRDYERACALVSSEGHGYIPSNAPPEIRIALAKYYADVNAPGYHRLRMYHEVCRRRQVAEYFLIIVGRYPSITELRSIMHMPPLTEMILQHLIENVHKYRGSIEAASAVQKLDQLLFYEPDVAYAFEINQVANRIHLIRGQISNMDRV